MKSGKNAFSIDAVAEIFRGEAGSSPEILFLSGCSQSNLTYKLSNPQIYNTARSSFVWLLVSWIFRDLAIFMGRWDGQQLSFLFGQCSSLAKL